MDSDAAEWMMAIWRQRQVPRRGAGQWKRREKRGKEKRVMSWNVVALNGRISRRLAVASIVPLARPTNRVKFSENFFRLLRFTAIRYGLPIIRHIEVNGSICAVHVLGRKNKSDRERREGNKGTSETRISGINPIMIPGISAVDRFYQGHGRISSPFPLDMKTTLGLRAPSANPRAPPNVHLLQG